MKKHNSYSLILYDINDRGCHIVTSHKTNHKGYPVLNINKSPMHIHRYMFLVYNGGIPDGLIVRHKCDNRKCINIKHLELGTPKDNSQDMVLRNRSTAGTKNPRAKLTEADILVIRESKESSYKLAKQFPVNPGAIRKIKQGKRWTHI